MGKLIACSLYCGAGGLDLGLKAAGIETVWANDFNAAACKTYKLHSPQTEVYCGDIRKVQAENIPDCDIMTGGFPCQGFSLGGKRVIDDPRNALYKEYVRVLVAKQPKCFIGENVRGLLSMGGGEVMKQIISDFADAGYAVFYELVNAKDFGVPQDRQRVILVGFRKDLGISDFKLPTYTGPKMTIGEALKDIPAPAPEDVYQSSYSPWFKMRNRRREFTDVSQTILATARQLPIWSGSPPMTKLHKDSWVFGEGETRRLSWQEAAAIQTFPKDMEFCGNLTNKVKQIGNAVPPKLAEWVAEAVKAKL